MLYYLNSFQLINLNNDDIMSAHIVHGSTGIAEYFNLIPFQDQTAYIHLTFYRLQEGHFF